MSSKSHPYNISVDNSRIFKILSEKRKPWWSAEVLNYLHNELDISLAEIGDLFNIRRQSVRHAAKKLDVPIERKRGRTKIVDKEQKRLDDFEKQSGLSDFIS